MKAKEFEALMNGLNDALAVAEGDAGSGARHRVEVTQSFIAATRRKAGLTQEQFARVTGASLGTVRKWERGERSPSGAAGMLVKIMANHPRIVIEAAGLERKRRAPSRKQAAV